jgi:alpha-galactosidase
MEWGGMSECWGAVVAELDVDVRSCPIHAEGWQSWTPTTAYRISDVQWAPVRPEMWTSGYGGSRPRPPQRLGVFQGDGRLIIDPGTGDDILADVESSEARTSISVEMCEPTNNAETIETAEPPEPPSPLARLT